MPDETQITGATRREFVATAAGVGLGLTALQYKAMAAPGASDKIRVGFIGLGGQGTGRLNEFLKHPDVEAVAVCDVDQKHVERAAGIVEKARGTKPEIFHDYRKLLERKDIDAVMVGTPDHWHALPTVQACQAGKDVFVEKPLCYSIGEGRAMANAAQKHSRVTQMGNHIHNDLPNYRRVVEMVQSGKLGKINRVYCAMASGEKSLGKPADTAPPPELDYDFWQGPAPKRPYNPNRSHFTYRYFWDYSSGYFIDFWCHYADVAYWALDLKAPKNVSAAGGRWLVDDNAETPDTLEVLYEYPELVLSWTLHPKGRPGYEHMGSCVIFEGTEATLVTNYNRNEIWAKGKLAPDFPRPEPSIPNSPGHIREFLDAVKSRKPTTCNIDYGYRLTKGGLLGVIAFRTGERIYWDDQKEKIIGKSKGHDLVSRKYRKPWKLS
ncbi:Gfo/Idh/MocA family oxidoreductase [uncultured Paludibaculum sp.]|uniref:Gfo/Idh/MocA family protein n=1 Tax=uncultured Paludibaculum sp. TaxID=1765020 RepID=UPI002AAA728D|nr:Gfo/Idh/MocA family oxidoreductase [uncultured Paludibaculum sp.]